MKKKLCKLIGFGLGCGVIMSSFSSKVFAEAVQTATKDPGIVIDGCFGLQEEQASEICSSVIKNIIEKYDGIYSFDNFEVSFFNEHKESGNNVVDIEVTADMTLIRDPQDSPFVQGMDAEIQNITDMEEKAAAITAMDVYLQQVNQYYMVPVLAGFSYRVYLSELVTADSLASSQFRIYHRVDAEDGAILMEMQENEVFTETMDAEGGREYIENAVKTKPEAATTRRITYSSSAATAYAIAHATDEPEYSAANGNGSDCANFVSKCLFEGGIPKDEEGGYSSGWYPGSLNWIQTGYNGETGVVLYLEKKGYFAPASNSDIIWMGNIMFWNNKSHVAMVTHIDGTSIFYSHHSNVTKENVYYLYDSAYDSVKFYVPKV